VLVGPNWNVRRPQQAAGLTTRRLLVWLCVAWIAFVAVIWLFARHEARSGPAIHDTGGRQSQT
jgi:hypothetical protein